MKAKKNLRLLLGALTMGIALTTANPIVAHAELVDETNEWTQEGETHYEDISQSENEQHTADNVQNQNNGGETPAPQNANAVVDNSQGGNPPSTTPDTPSGTGSTGNADPKQGEVTNWEDYDPTTDPTWNPIDPRLPDGLPDEVDKKSYPDHPDNPDHPDHPETPTNTTTTTTTTVPVNTLVVKEQEIPHTGVPVAEGAATVAGLAGIMAGLKKIISSRRKFKTASKNK